MLELNQKGERIFIVPTTQEQQGVKGLANFKLDGLDEPQLKNGMNQHLTNFPYSLLQNFMECEKRIWEQSASHDLFHSLMFELRSSEVI